VVERARIHPALTALREIAKIESEVSKHELRSSVLLLSDGMLTIKLLTLLATDGKLDESTLRVRRMRQRIGTKQLSLLLSLTRSLAHSPLLHPNLSPLTHSPLLSSLLSPLPSFFPPISVFLH
jgi:hypothetical protein